MWNALIGFWREPPLDLRREPSAWDHRLVFAVLGCALVEGLLRDDLVARGFQIAVTAVSVSTLWFRQTRPCAATVVTFTLAILVTIAEMWLRLPKVMLGTSAFVLLLPYALFRRAAGRQALIGLGFMAVAYAVAALNGEMAEVSDAIGGAIVMLFPAVLGLAVRFRAVAHMRDVEHAKLREREQLARELHDTVAHHVAAIAVQAQAGRAVLSTTPAAAATALDAIDEEARRTLVELRAIVGALRDDAPLTQQGRIADIAGLARHLRVQVELSGELAGLRPSVEAALYRLAQEAITNATKHARRATGVRVRIASEGAHVRLTVDNDGEATSARTQAGFGLIGMRERVQLLGGTLEVGPRPEGGWRVEATVPRSGNTG